MATLTELSLTDLYVNDNGVIMPDTSEVKTLVEELFTDALGQSCDFTPETPLGRLVESLTFVITGVVRINALCAGQIDPYHSTGNFLDAVAAFHNVYRKSRIRTVVTAKLTGTASVTVPAGSLASTDAGDIFFLTEDVTLNENGEGEGIFSSSEYGPVPCDAGALSHVDTAIVGWTGVTNESAGILGADTESDDSLRDRVVASNDSGVGFVNSIRSEILAVDGVRSCVVYENSGSATTVMNGVVVSPHSVYICVEGGNSDEIAEAIYRKKPAGCGMTGVKQGQAQESITGISTTTNVAVTDATYKDDGTGASYAIRFYRPSTFKPRIDITVRRWSYAGTNLAADVQAAVVAYATGLDIGAEFTAFGIGMAVQTALPTIGIVSVKIDGADEIAVYGYQVPRPEPRNVFVTVA
ncbi:MAG: baseplate J/gp47 family protein [Kiritimatiellae bacterium]|nr:baseplate J/gp47 family protein [Kiritimatiellia bacterium]